MKEKEIINEVLGYKAYEDIEELKTGLNKDLFCGHLEDTFRFIHDSINKDIHIAIVKPHGKVISFDRESLGYYDLRYTENHEPLELVRELTREEIIDYASSLGEFGMKKFVSGYRLSEEEQQKFKGKTLSVDDAISYYQQNNKEVYKERAKRYE